MASPVAFHVRYAITSFRRGGVRSWLAIGCIAVGVMAIVSVQLGGIIFERTLEADARIFVGGDLQVSSPQVLLSEGDIGKMNDLESNGTVSAWTASRSFSQASGRRGTGAPKAMTVTVVDPSLYPLAGNLTVVQPSSASFKDLLSQPGSAVVSEELQAELQAFVGDQYAVATDVGPLTVTIVGIIQNASLNAAFSMYVSTDTVKAQAEQPLTYDTIYALSANPAAAAKVLKKQYPSSFVSTVADVLVILKAVGGLVKDLLEVAGIVALLVGGVGILNTMQVLLSRRRIEIAMLKTVGYRRRDLFVLFGLEALMLGTIGGTIGAVLGIAASYGVKSIIENVVLLHLQYEVDPSVVAGGVLIGMALALIFGLVPIVNAAAIRPLAILRDEDERRHIWRRRSGSFGLVLLVVLLFTFLVSGILGDLRNAIAVVVGGGSLLIGLYIVFLAAVSIVGLLPVPEHHTVRHTIVVTIAVLVSIGITLASPGVGLLFLAFTLMGYVVVHLPRTHKIAVRLAFRGIGRHRRRAAATALALFVGIFAIALIVIPAEDAKQKIDSFIAAATTYNVFVNSRTPHADRIESTLPTLGGLKDFRQQEIINVQPVSIDGRPIADIVAAGQTSNPYFNVGDLAQISGPNLTKTLPTGTVTKSPEGIPYGRLLGAADQTTTNASVKNEFGSEPYNVHVGSHIVFLNPVEGKTLDVTVVGFFDHYGFTSQLQLDFVVTSSAAVEQLGIAEAQSQYALKIDPAATAADVTKLANADPDAEISDAASFVAVFEKLLTNVLLLFLMLASLALAAAVVLIANAVALAMLERRREIGILKSVGFGSPDVLTQVILEYGVVGGLSGATAIAVVGATIGIFSLQIGVNLPVDPVVALVIAGTAASIGVITAGLVAYAPTRVRPLEVLRYE